MNGSDFNLMSDTFINKLNNLLSINRPENLSNSPEITLPKDPINTVETALNHILKYFTNASSVLNALLEQNNIQWVFESQHAVADIRTCTYQTMEYLPRFMETLEKFRQERENCKSTTPSSESGILGCLRHLPPTTTASPSLSRHKRITAFDTVTNRKLHDIASNLQEVLFLLRQTCSHTDALKIRINIAAEWTEFQNDIMAEIEREIDACFLLLSEIQKNKFSSSQATRSPRDISKVACVELLPNTSENSRKKIYKYTNHPKLY